MEEICLSYTECHQDMSNLSSFMSADKIKCFYVKYYLFANVYFAGSKVLNLYV